MGCTRSDSRFLALESASILLRDTNHVILTISVASHGFLCHHSSSVTRRNERWYVLVSVASRMALFPGSSTRVR